MKKLLPILSCITIIIISGCSSHKTPYEDLPTETQQTIQAAIKQDLFNPYLEKTSQMIAISGIDQKQVIDNNTKELREATKRYLAKKYPDIDFDSLIEKMK